MIMLSSQGQRLNLKLLQYSEKYIKLDKNTY